MNSWRRRVIASTLGAVIILAACGGGEGGGGPTPPADVAHVEIAALAGAVAWPATTQLTATLKDAGNRTLTGRDILWESRHPTVATVTPQGLLSSVNLGSATIVASSEGIQDSITISVTVPIVSVVISPLPDTMLFGAATSLTLGMTDAKGNPRPGFPVTWSSGNSDVLAVDGVGQVTAAGAGRTFVTVTADGASDSVSSTVLVQFLDVKVAYSHTCALAADGAAYCWGKNHRGQLGDSTSTDRDYPVKVKGGRKFVQVATSSYNDLQGHSCGLDVNGDVYCWGNNENGELGNAATPNGIDTGAHSTVPVMADGGHEYVWVAVNSSYTCAVADTGKVYCWGYNGWGQLGRGTQTVIEPVPGAVHGNVVYQRVTAGYRYACGQDASGTAYCWGQNGSGQLGVGDFGTHNVPTLVSGGVVFGGVVAGAQTTCAGSSTFAPPYCWGFNTGGQVGDGTQTNRNTPTAVSGAAVISNIAQSCYISDPAFELFCWGPGTSATPLVPTQTATGFSWADVSVNTYHMCGLTWTYKVYCWGSDSNGQLGNGAAPGSATPVEVQFQQ